MFESCLFFLLRTILKHEDLDGKIKTACLGSLLLQDDLNRLEEQYLSHREVNTCTALNGRGKVNLFMFITMLKHQSLIFRLRAPQYLFSDCYFTWFRCVNEQVYVLSFLQDKVKLWLSTALKKEEERWLSSKTPELIDHYYFSPLAVDVIQVRHRQHR